MSKISRQMAAAVLAVVMLGVGAGTAAAQGRFGRVEAFSFDSWTVTANAGDMVTVVVRGDGDTDLDLFILDGFGRTVVSDQRSGDYCMVTFTVTRGGTFPIRVRNYGGVYNEYVISTSIR